MGREKCRYYHSGESKLFGKFRVRVGLALKIPEWLKEEMLSPSRSSLLSLPLPH